MPINTRPKAAGADQRPGDVLARHLELEELVDREAEG
jgi:hypothetical protein